MKHLKNAQNIQIESKNERLRDLGITHKCYVFLSGDDKNTTNAKNITAYGLQHATMITKEDNSKDLNEKKSAVQVEDGEHVLIDGVEFITHLIGDYSDCIHFEEVDYNGTSKVHYEMKVS